MLQSIREKAQGWIAWVIVILISIPFALWGIQEYLGVGSAAVKVTVNDRDITDQEFESDYRRFRDQLRQQMGSSYRPDLLDDKMLREEVLASVIRSELVYQQAIDLNLRASDEILRELIKSNKAFQVGGIFNQSAYENATRRIGLTTDGYEMQMRQFLVSDQLTRAVTASEITTNKELGETLRLINQRRKTSYIIVPAKQFLAAAKPKQEDVEAYYNANKSTFMSPERVKLEYLELDIKNLAKTVKVDDDELRLYFEQNQKEYQVPEQRRASHILITLDASADEATKNKARATAEAALKRVKSGEDFAKVAKDLSQDPGSAKEGGDLGFFGKGIMDKEFEKVVFALHKGAISGLVKSQFGYHIIKLTDIKAPKGKSFDELKGELVEAYRKEQAGQIFYEYAEKLADLTYEDPDSLEPAADALGLKVSSSDWVGRDGGEGIFANGRVISAAFSEDVLVERHNSELLDLGEEHVLALRVVEHEQPQVKPLEQVRADIEQILKSGEASKQAELKSKELMELLKQGETLGKVATAHKAQLKQAVEVGRNSKDLPVEILQTLFKMPKPEGEVPSYAVTALASGDYAVIALQQVIDGSDAGMSEEDKSKLKASMERSIGEANSDHLVENMRDRSDIVMPEEKK
jgi:peptidyl-prolyl cis-trans isomerase D